MGLGFLLWVGGGGGAGVAFGLRVGIVWAGFC